MIHIVKHMITMHDIDNNFPDPADFGRFLGKLTEKLQADPRIVEFGIAKGPHSEWAEVTYHVLSADLKAAYETADAIDKSVYDAGGFYR